MMSQAIHCVTGTIKFRRPAVYIFPGGQGDSCLFGIDGFALLIDGGFGRKPRFWEVARHLNRIDAILMSRLAPNTVFSMAAFIKQMRDCFEQGTAFPPLGCFFGNLPRGTVKEEQGTKKHPLAISIFDAVEDISRDLEALRVPTFELVNMMTATAKKPEPVVLYNKVGHGSLQMFVLSPPKDSQEMKELREI